MRPELGGVVWDREEVTGSIKSTAGETFSNGKQESLHHREELVAPSPEAWWDEGGLQVEMSGLLILTDPGRTLHLSSPSQLPGSSAPYAGQYGEIISMLAQERSKVVCF